MKRVIYPGTFDPVTNGHIDVIHRATGLFDEVVVTVARNPSKSPLFTVSERLFMLKECLKEFENVVVDSFSGLIVDHAKEVEAIGIIRGLRAVSDFEYEFQMALMNRKLDENLRTIFLMPHEKYTYLNSTIVRNLAQFDGDISDFVPPIVVEKLKEKNLYIIKNGDIRKQELREDF
ncbi:MAG: pantetheine-phosphate adenylyltransferase [Ignavibacteriae bacterium HGW-Ignavibacteriae-2]|jgi:pantetheine-phosphate adenylyltransferase|nr:pantetheine-phosphate adenylyltransferase [Bacteroidota bacterium]PKL90165.1 MAG: pantetheine-phosphate adenylyltransferase [Ignavibacteriae bacterium HGW-Ignavibacteriae-2]